MVVEVVVCCAEVAKRRVSTQRGGRKEGSLEQRQLHTCNVHPAASNCELESSRELVVDGSGKQTLRIQAWVHSSRSMSSPRDDHRVCSQSSK